MTENSLNSKSVERTKHRLRKALRELLSKESIEKITVKALTDKADLTRATFYIHYSDLDGFYNESINHVLHALTKQLIKFLDDGEQKAKQNSNRKNYIISDDDIELLRLFLNILSDYELYEKGDKIFDELKKYMTDKYSEDFIEENETKLRIFCRGYAYCLTKALVSTDAGVVYYNLRQCFSIWNHFFREFPSYETKTANVSIF